MKGLISSLDPDVVSLVEVDEPVAGPSPLTRLATELAYHSVFVPALEYGTDHPRGQFGNAILSRTPLLDVRQHSLLWPPRRYDGTEPSEPRSLALGRIHSAGNSMWIGATHLPRADAAARHVAARRIQLVMRDMPRPWVLVGDFNMDVGMWRRTYPAFGAYADDATPTYPTARPAERIDYCLAPEGADIEVRALRSAASDHLPIIVTVRDSGHGDPP